MRVTHKQKIYGLVGALALGSLAFDKLSGGAQPAEAAGAVAEQIAPAVAVVPSSATQTATAARSNPAPPSLVTRLKNLMSGENVDLATTIDAFAPAKRWLPVAAPAPVSHVAIAAEDFRKSHSLSAVMQSAKGGMAIVNGQLIRVGAIVEGYKLVSISATGAKFAGESGEVELKMENP